MSPLPVSWRSRQSVAAEGLEAGRHWQPSAWYWPETDLYAGRPQIVTLCGSTRFVDDFNEWRKTFTHRGYIVLSIEIVTTQQYHEDPQHVDRANKEMLDALHLEKIKISDRIFVINKGGYIGESTRREIEFAKQLDLPIQYLEPVT